MKKRSQHHNSSTKKCTKPKLKGAVAFEGSKENKYEIYNKQSDVKDDEDGYNGDGDENNRSTNIPLHEYNHTIIIIGIVRIYHYCYYFN